jgi:hypothetical protein
MELTLSALLGIVIALSIGIPVLFIASARYFAYRLAGRPESWPVSASGPVTIPLPENPSRWLAMRTLLPVLVLGLGTGVMLLRYVYGLGAVTNLSDQFPWGIWIGFDVMSGVALAAGAFVIAATAHIFGAKRFEPLVRPAILTGLLGYLLVVGGLMVDLGRPYNVWRPLVHWQHHSVMWEVGLCVASYTTVLMIEFLPVVLERLNRFKSVTKRLPTVSFYRFLKKVSIAFVILGVLPQESLDRLCYPGRGALDASPVITGFFVGPGPDQVVSSVVLALSTGLLLDLGSCGGLGNDHRGVYA